MSIIIRLQNLPWSANALDIRQYFQGLSIPEGGVHIVGGELGDAFIAFSTDEDARQAFLRNNGKIKEIQITLMLSSRTEMQRVIEQARSTSFAAFSAQPAAQVAPAAPQPLPAAVPPVARAQSPDSDRERKKQGKRRSRSRSKSRERDRSRERKSRRYRERSRSRDRSDRRDRRRRERSRSRGRSRSRDKSTRRSKDNIDRSKELKQRPEVWANPQPANPTDVLVGKGLLGNFPSVAAKVTLDALQGLLPRRDSNWSPPQGLNNGRGGFIRNNKSRFDNNSASKFETMEIDDDEEDTRDCCIKLEPFYGNYTDLRKFFTGLHISYKGIKMINDDSGHRTGVCYIKFYNAKFKHDAVERNGRDLNGISVKIQHLDDEIFEKSVDKYKPHYDPQDNSNNTYNHPRHKNITKYFNNHNGMSDIDSDIKDFTCLKVEELPNYAKEQDILHMFSLHPLLALHLTPRGRGGTGHIAYVKFSSSDVAIQALNERQQHVVGGKTVLVRPCADDEFEAISRERDVDLEIKRESTPPITTECLELTRLPQKTNDRDISDFFSDIGLIPTKIHLISNNSGFTGTAYCEFDSIEEANNAVKKDGSTIGTATVSVKPISKNDMEATLKSTLTIPAINTIIPPPTIQQQQPSVILPPPPIIQPLVPTLTAPLRLFPPQRMPFAQARGRGRGAPFNQRGVGMRPPRYPPGPPGGAGNGEEAPPGCTVYMDNVPYKAGTNEILEFFEGYNCTNNVSRRYNPNNTPSAEAKVTFFSPEEAARAVEELHGQKIWERSIFLTQV